MSVSFADLQEEKGWLDHWVTGTLRGVLFADSDFEGLSFVGGFEVETFDAVRGEFVFVDEFYCSCFCCLFVGYCKRFGLCCGTDSGSDEDGECVGYRALFHCGAVMSYWSRWYKWMMDRSLGP